jgi:hypothetical protein
MPETLKELLSYEPETGIFRWKSSRGRVKAGDVAGCSKNSCGYVQIKVKGLSCKAHRLAWLFVYGDIPKEEIDHINGIRADNRICNLRLATRAQNQRNRGITKRSSSGLKGAYWYPRLNCWVAKIRVNGRLLHLGYWPSKYSAHNAYKFAVPLLHKEFARV